MQRFDLVFNALPSAEQDHGRFAFLFAQLAADVETRFVFEQGVQNNAFLVPQQALLRDFGGDAFVFLVGPGNKALRRKVTAIRAYGANWVVTEGLTKGDKIITQGLNNLKQGMAVRAVPASKPQPVGSAAKQGGPNAPSGKSGG